MAKAPKGQGQDQEASAIFIALAAIVLAILAWVLLGPKLSAWMGVLRRYEMLPFAFFFEGAAQLHRKLVALDGRSLDFSNTLAMLQSTGAYVRWLYVPLIAALGVVLLVKSSRGRFRRQFTMASLAEQEAALWPEIAPVAGKQIELVTARHDAGPWAVALTEWEFAEKHKLASRASPVVDRDRARQVFVQQLGPRWAGPQALPKHARGLYGALLLYISGERDQGQDCLRIMAKSFAAGGLETMDTRVAEAAIAKCDGHPNVRRALQQHAYVFTVMATLLQVARASGVLASPMFIWLKTVDRRLWYTLNNVGRYAFHVECAGIASHWLFEKSVGEACPTPMVERAIDGLEMALREYAEDDSLDLIYK